MILATDNPRQPLLPWHPPAPAVSERLGRKLLLDLDLPGQVNLLRPDMLEVRVYYPQGATYTERSALAVSIHNLAAHYPSYKVRLGYVTGGLQVLVTRTSEGLFPHWGK